jgi:hypothetical protein
VVVVVRLLHIERSGDLVRRGRLPFGGTTERRKSLVSRVQFKRTAALVLSPTGEEPPLSNAQDA